MMKEMVDTQQNQSEVITLIHQENKAMLKTMVDTQQNQSKAIKIIQRENKAMLKAMVDTQQNQSEAVAIMQANILKENQLATARSEVTKQEVRRVRQLMDDRNERMINIFIDIMQNQSQAITTIENKALKERNLLHAQNENLINNLIKTQHNQSIVMFETMAQMKRDSFEEQTPIITAKILEIVEIMSKMQQNQSNDFMEGLNQLQENTLNKMCVTDSSRIEKMLKSLAQIHNNQSEVLLDAVVQRQCRALQTLDVTVDARIGQIMQMQVNLSAELIEAIEQTPAFDLRHLAEVITSLKQNHSQALQSGTLSQHNQSVIETKLDAILHTNPLLSLHYACPNHLPKKYTHLGPKGQSDKCYYIDQTLTPMSRVRAQEFCTQLDGKLR